MDHLHQLFLRQELERIEKQELFRQLYPDHVFDEQKLYNICSLLMRLYEEFTALKFWKEQPLRQRLTTLEGLPAKHSGEFQRNFRKLQTQLGRYDQAPGMERNLVRYQGEMLHMAYLLRQNRSPGPALQQADEALERFYYAAKLRLACEFLNRKQVIRQEFQPRDASDLIGWLRSRPEVLASDPALLMYFHIYQILDQPHDPAPYQACLELLQQSTSDLHPTERLEGCTYCINYCIRRINQGEQAFSPELFRLYQWAFASQTLMPTGLLDVWHFKNAVTIGIRLEAFDWVEQCIVEQINWLPEEVRDNAFHYNLASLYFARKQYEEAKKLLLRVEFTDVYYNLDSRVLLARIYFEQREGEALLSVLQSLRTFLERNKVISVVQKELYLNFSRLLKRLESFRNKLAILAKARLITEKEKLDRAFGKYTNVAQVGWLRQQYEALVKEI